MKQILITYGNPKETVIAIMMLYKRSKEMVLSPDGDRDFFDIVDWLVRFYGISTFVGYLMLNQFLCK